MDVDQDVFFWISQDTSKKLGEVVCDENLRDVVAPQSVFLSNKKTIWLDERSKIALLSLAKCYDSPRMEILMEQTCQDDLRNMPEVLHES